MKCLPLRPVADTSFANLTGHSTLTGRISCARFSLIIHPVNIWVLVESKPSLQQSGCPFFLESTVGEITIATHQVRARVISRIKHHE